MDFLPGTRGINDMLAIGFADGSLRIQQKTGKVERHVNEAHKGAIISLRWSQDGNSLVTCGEDGAIKIYSRNGNLRSNLV